MFLGRVKNGEVFVMLPNREMSLGTCPEQTEDNEALRITYPVLIYDYVVIRMCLETHLVVN